MQFRLRRPCPTCETAIGTVALANSQVIGRCVNGHFNYCVPKAELAAQLGADAYTQLEREQPVQLPL